MLLIVAELPEFIRTAHKLLTADERQDVVRYLAEHPKAGDLIEGTGGVRKLRWGRGGQGKMVDLLVMVEKKTIMSNAFDNIKRGLLEAIEHAEGRAPETRMHRPRPVDVKALRSRIGMTQEQFASRFGFSTATLRHWERGDRTPHGPALVLLNVIAHNPSAVMDALATA